MRWRWMALVEVTVVKTIVGMMVVVVVVHHHRSSHRVHAYRWRVSS